MADEFFTFPTACSTLLVCYDICGVLNSTMSELLVLWGNSDCGGGLYQGNFSSLNVSVSLFLYIPALAYPGYL